MKSWMKIGIGVLVLVVGSVSLPAQQTGGSEPPPDSDRCACSAGGADCLWGDAEGCQITCNGALCDCRGASCVLGFPRPARCRCKAPPST